MPLYTYQCRDHGEFSAWAQMASSDQPQPCPSCATPAERALARPMIAGKGADNAADLGCGSGACAAPPPGPGGHVCGAGCAH
jgi:putative FmdB family regulatory protein